MQQCTGVKCLRMWSTGGHCCSWQGVLLVCGGGGWGCDVGCTWNVVMMVYWVMECCVIKYCVMAVV